MRKPATIAILMAAILFALQGVAPGTTVVKLSNKQLMKRAEMAFHGRCVEKESFVNERDEVVTRYTFEVTEMIKGDETKRTVTFVQHGGVVGARGHYIPGVARFQRGEEVVTFVARPDREGEPTFTVGLAQGKFMVKEEEGETVVRRSLHGLKLFDWKTGKVADEAVIRAMEEESYRLKNFLAEMRSYAEEQAKKDR